MKMVNMHKDAVFGSFPEETLQGQTFRAVENTQDFCELCKMEWPLSFLQAKRDYHLQIHFFIHEKFKVLQ